MYKIQRSVWSSYYSLSTCYIPGCIVETVKSTLQCTFKNTPQTTCDTFTKRSTTTRSPTTTCSPGFLQQRSQENRCSTAGLPQSLPEGKVPVVVVEVPNDDHHVSFKVVPDLFNSFAVLQDITLCRHRIVLEMRVLQENMAKRCHMDAKANQSTLLLPGFTERPLVVISPSEHFGTTIMCLYPGHLSPVACERPQSKNRPLPTPRMLDSSSG